MIPGLSKRQNKACKQFPTGWSNQEQLTKAGIDRSVLLALQSKGAVDFRGEGKDKEYRLRPR